MKAILTNTKGGLPRTHSRGSVRLVLMLATLTLLLAGGTVALAQDPEVGNVNGYAPKKTISDYENGGNRDAGDFDYGKIDLRVGVWLDRDENEVYQRGDEMGAGFQTNQDAYAVVYRIDADGLVTVLWPRSRMDDGFAFGGHEYLLPVAGGRKLRVSTNEGEGFVEAIVSKYPFDLRDLEIDFHHELGADRFDFRVAGDPFLAMNEVNFAVTGLENSEQYVVTNYSGYYVHREVEHPRYLCNQCHFEDDVAYEPYRDSCTLEITYDYGWVNSWYADYGYYPVYANPVYVYVDPWTWRPWINFWYWPSYVCAPYYGYGWYGGGCYSWGYSPYYAGNCYTSYNNGYQRYRPLTNSGTNGSVTKTREYGRVSRMVNADTPDSRQRDAMTNRTRMSELDGVKGRSTTMAANGSRGRGDESVKATSRARPQFDDGARVRGNSGLRIRDGGNTSSRSRKTGARGSGSDAEYRHRAGGSTNRSGLVPVARGSGSRSTTVRGSSGSRSGGAVIDRKSGSRPSRGTNQRTIKPVEPRKRGTRVWNSGRNSESGGRTDRTRGSSVKPRSSQKGTSGTKNTRSSVKPRSGTSQRKSSGTKSSGSVGNNNSRSKSSSGGSRSSGSSGGGSRSSGGSRGSGGGSKGGGNRGGGGTSHRR